MTNTVEQIEYNNWGAQLASGHEEYWAHIGYIANFIALMLEGYQTRFKSTVDGKFIHKPTKHTTITVHQYKEKFGQPRVYWSAADPELVEIQYQENVLNRTKTPPKMSLEQYRERCLQQDILHYRSVYYIMKQCFPQYWRCITSGADNPEYLFETKEEYIKEMENQIKTTDPRWRPTHLEKEKDFIFDLFKWND